MKVLEMFSGIGGMHLALADSNIPFDVKASIDINPVANAVYRHNFPKTSLLNRNIENLSVDFIKELNVDTILMSPPCQPFTRNGLKGDIADNRTNAFKCFLDLLPQLTNIKKILLENVKGFENSVMREIFLETLKKTGFSYQEFILNPTQFGIPNSRLRYYCLAAQDQNNFQLNSENKIVVNLQSQNPEIFPLLNILEKDVDFQNYRIPEKILQKRFKVLDICYSNSRRSCCFTKAYGRYLEGTGSVFSENTEEQDKEILRMLSKVESPEEQLQLLRTLKLRFFTPKEISRLMCFPEYFSFPDNVTVKQKYMLLGNSVNVKVVSELIKLLNS